MREGKNSFISCPHTLPHLIFFRLFFEEVESLPFSQGQVSHHRKISKVILLHFSFLLYFFITSFVYHLRLGLDEDFCSRLYCSSQHEKKKRKDTVVAVV